MSDENHGLDSLAQDHRELRNTVTSILENVATLGGKIDTMITVVERALERQERHEQRTDRLEADIQNTRETLRKERLEESKEIHSRINGMAIKMAMASGAIGFLALLPTISKMLPLLSGG